MVDEHVRELRLSVNAEALLNESDIHTYLDSSVFSPVLSRVDGEYKRRHASDMILFADDGFVYRV